MAVFITCPICLGVGFNKREKDNAFRTCDQCWGQGMIDEFTGKPREKDRSKNNDPTGGR